MRFALLVMLLGFVLAALVRDRIYRSVDGDRLTNMGGPEAVVYPPQK